MQSLLIYSEQYATISSSCSDVVLAKESFYIMTVCKQFMESLNFSESLKRLRKLKRSESLQR